MKNTIKEKVLFDILNEVGKVQVIVKYSEDVHIGSREFSKLEKEIGLLLVLNKNKNWVWNEEYRGIQGEFIFGEYGVQKCFIPVSSIVSIISQELGVQLVTSFSSRTDVTLSKNVAQVDFKNRKIL